MLNLKSISVPGTWYLIGDILGQGIAHMTRRQQVWLSLAHPGEKQGLRLVLLVVLEIIDLPVEKAVLRAKYSKLVGNRLA